MREMGLVHYILVTLLVLSQIVLHSAEGSTQCQKLSHFDCGEEREISFPFFRIDGPKCGVIAMNCTGTIPKVRFSEKGKWYQVNYISYLNMRMEILDEDVQGQLKSNRCDLLANFTEQAYLLNFTERVPPFTSFEIVETRPFFKCKHKANFSSTFFNQFDSYSCNSCALYFHKNGSRLPPLPENLTNSCSVVRLPHPSYELGKGKDSLASYLSPCFTIVWEVREDCMECYHKGWQCQSTKDKRFECSKNKGPNVGKKILIGVFSATGVVILGVIILSLNSTLKNSGKLVFSGETATTRKFQEFINRQASYAPKRYSFKEIKKMTQSFRTKLGHGGYGSVFKGTLHDGKLVAVKVLKEIEGNGEEFINEVSSISRTSHVNIVTLLGYCFDGSKRALVYEFMPNGSLEKYIYNKDSSVGYSNLGWATLHNISVGIARGLEYLHRGCNTRILHFDIKPHNILLDQDFCPKISDFGLAKLCPRKDSIISMFGARGTAGYIAPEVFCRNFGGVSHKSDVYSYGMMILEMVGGRKNIAIAVDHTSEIYFPHWIHKRIELNEDLGLHGIVSEVQDDITRKMILVGLWCIQTNPFDRPAMSRVLEMLEGSLEILEIPPKPYLFSPSRLETGSSIN